MSASMFATGSKFPDRFTAAGWAASLLLHAAAAVWLIPILNARARPAPAMRRAPAMSEAKLPALRRALEKARKASAEITIRRLQIARVRRLVELPPAAAPNEARRSGRLPASAANGSFPLPRDASPERSADELRAAAADFEAIRARKMEVDGGVPADLARKMSGADPLANTAREAAQSGDMQQMLLAVRDLARAAHHLPEGPTGVTVAADPASDSPASHEAGEGQAQDLTLPGSPVVGPPGGLGHGAMDPAPARKVAAGAERADWIFIDSWYCFGPYPNPRRANIDKAFEPEALVNLDGADIGKKGRPLTWRFLQSPTPDVVPLDAQEYAIYYLYTELRFDRPRDLWVAMGSDDQSKIWLNGQKIWQSSDVLKGWKIDEGYRKVHFNAGINRVLARLENGWRGTAISMCIKLSDR